MVVSQFLEVVIKIEVKDNNVEQALRVLKENSKKTDFIKSLNLKIHTRNHQKRKKNFTRKY